MVKRFFLGFLAGTWCFSLACCSLGSHSDGGEGRGEESPGLESSDHGEGESEAGPGTDRGLGAFQALKAKYGLLSTVAGLGESHAHGVLWKESYEGGPAVAAQLSRPHTAEADSKGRIYITDKEAHAIRMVDEEGLIHTLAGTGEAGDDGDELGPAKTMRLDEPNGLYVTGKDVVFVLDRNNGKVRRIENGKMSTFITIGDKIDGGRGLYVDDDEKRAFVAAKDKIYLWEEGKGLRIFASGFKVLGNLALDPEGTLYVTDRKANFVYKIAESGRPTVVAGNGTKKGGGDGQLATETGLDMPRGIAFTEDGGFFLGTHKGDQVWWVSPYGTIHLFIDGEQGAHSGDGAPFDLPGKKVSEVRALSLDKDKNLLIVENDKGYVRKVWRVEAEESP